MGAIGPMRGSRRSTALAIAACVACATMAAAQLPPQQKVIRARLVRSGYPVHDRQYVFAGDGTDRVFYELAYQSCEPPAREYRTFILLHSGRIRMSRKVYLLTL